jgi:glutaredoxin 3
MVSVKIYTTNYCGYCAAAKDFLREKGLSFEEIDVTGDDELRARLVEMSSGMRTVPQIFIGNKHIGGYTDLRRLDADGSLITLLAA